MPFQMLPPAEGVCPVCAVAHAPEQPHNRDSLYYRMRFEANHGRAPTWADAIGHCAPEIVELWQRELTLMGEWTEPPEGQGVIADPPHDSLREPVAVGSDPVIVKVEGRGVVSYDSTSEGGEG
jgi:hypothetical protein